MSNPVGAYSHAGSVGPPGPALGGVREAVAVSRTSSSEVSHGFRHRRSACLAADGSSSVGRSWRLATGPAAQDDAMGSPADAAGHDTLTEMVGDSYI